MIDAESAASFVTKPTRNPTESWVCEQTDSYLQHAKRQKLPVKMLFHDRDAKFTATVDADLERASIEVVETAFRAPNTNAYVERFIQTGIIYLTQVEFWL